MEKRDTKKIRQRMRSLLEQADYDFSQFTFDGFVHWLEQKRGRRIAFSPRPMESIVCGGWLAGDDCEFIFYDAGTAPLYQTHIKLHELSHILCGHSTLYVGKRGIHGTDTADVPSVLLRSAHQAHSSDEEIEADVMTALIQEQVIRHARLKELTTVRSSDRETAEYFKAMGF